MAARLVSLLVLFLLCTPYHSQAVSPQRSGVDTRLSVPADLAGLAGRIGPSALRMAMEGYDRLRREGRLGNTDVLTIIDYSRPSVKERLFVVDVRSGRLLLSSLVAHGRNSGGNTAVRFSNTEGSYKSSPGFFVTGATYYGKHGYSLRLKGLEHGINSNAEKRHIVIHGADYVSEDFIRRYGRLGRSLGCPALPVDTSGRLINLIKDGSCLFIYNGDEEYVDASRFVSPDVALQGQDRGAPGTS
ncbi:murein L,D-transpeptidase catalytic domain family protein [Prosthecochloris sp. N3]|uniref:Murein L,D-transpeptidase catalytic domain family protein n=1 Tax=Prosthecochloris ethylica TaxID=2743976 RepID=A0ABR9XP32_9CHLB|nr:MULTISPECIES: murein L,D-transpeptidase catalytic domain family protein [Prosthecochloris]MEC9487385.1 murein L,D-transpeptidase catalytic domain family protein [Prosthecochloris sp.]MBF0585717.1 murein L,D-transpeptidase catalytic domain family protein [Prosthecochloris ethylica]MBF0635627.1 murein L,D-transpeptidase catalytic domain family protein [Prosthecochloris ethylica]NUK46926.1 murein L,D-transpeptidase catalytic domain family protein [Prosthecochloris ethylica]RNA65421.1 hypotheti